jgi:site-specific recombinase XerD
MYIAKIKLKDGTHYYSFSYDKDGKRIRLKKDQHPHFTDRKSAEQWAKSRKGFEESSRALITKKTAWKTQFYDFEPLVKQYADWQQLHAPNSYKNNIIYFEQYVLAWFLGVKKQNNVNGWHFLYTEFTTYLRTTCSTARSKQIITIATANKIIHTLNSFVRFLSLHNLIDPSAAMKCPSFPEHMQNQKTIDDIIPENEFAIIHKKLVLANSDSADFFLMLYRTGMRLNEALSMPISALFKGKMDGALHEELKEKGIDYIGYFVLESQCEDTARTRDEKTFAHTRKPLKGRKKIHNKDSRLVPIREKELWNMLAKRYKEQKELQSKEVFGKEAINYLFFNDLTASRFAQDLKESYKGTSFSEKSAHSCRHSFATLFAGETRSFFLAKMILGHKSKAFEGYMHLYEQLAQVAKRNSQEIDEVI